MKNKLSKKLVCMGLVTTMLCATGCGSAAPGEETGDLMAGIKITADANESLTKDVKYDEEAGAVAVSGFGAALLKNCYTADGNVLISPLSVISALAMTANGAKEETLCQMEEVFGMEADELSAYLRAYRKGLLEGEKYKLSMANGIWFNEKDDFKVDADFLLKNGEYFDASVYKTVFSETTKDEINQWVEDKTDGMVRDILDKMSEDAVMYLVNALAFDARWQDIYNANQVKKADFTKEDGTKQNVDMMYSAENVFIQDANATGFFKYYADEAYAFVGILPNEGVSVADYIASLDGNAIRTLLNSKQNTKVNVCIPKFEGEYSVEMSSVLTALGMKDAFDMEKADFTGMGTVKGENIYINRVLHKTYIAVDENGTKAGAATVVEVNVTSTALRVEPKFVMLDRPFVYMIIDCENQVPVFIGTVMSVAE